MKETQTDNILVEEKAGNESVEEKLVTESETNNVKVVRRILVHRSGKVVRVLNEHYFDVTTNIYVEPGFNNPSLPAETEREHYEKILKASAKPAPAPAPVAPAKAPVERIPFAKRLATSEKDVKQAYNEIKSELLSYGLKSRISMSGDTFRLHTNEYAKIVVAGKSLKMYLALNTKDYKDSPIPFSDASKMSAHKETPFVFKIKSGLSVRRAKQLIADLAKKNKFEQGEVVAHNHAKDVK